MKKIPTLFERVYENHRVADILDKVTEGMEWVLDGEGTATVKYDGSCCAIINGEFYKRYDAKKGKPIPDGAIKCQNEPDPITGHMPCWVKCDRNNPSDKWFWTAYDNYRELGKIDGTTKYDTERKYILPKVADGTYEAVGKHFQGNPYNMDCDILMRHGDVHIKVDRTFEGIKKYLFENYIEGIVFYDKYSIPACKIKRTDFGFEWNGNISKCCRNCNNCCYYDQFKDCLKCMLTGDLIPRNEYCDKWEQMEKEHEYENFFWEKCLKKQGNKNIKEI